MVRALNFGCGFRNGEERIRSHESQLLNFQEFDELASKIELYMLIIKLNISKTKEINTQNSALHTHTVTLLRSFTPVVSTSGNAI